MGSCTKVEVKRGAGRNGSRPPGLEALTAEILAVSQVPSPSLPLTTVDPVQRRIILEAMPQMAWSSRFDGYCDFCNSRFNEYIGLPDGAADGDSWVGLILEEDRQRVFEAWKRSTASGTPFEVEHRMRHSSGTFRWVFSQAQPVKDAEGAVICWIGTCTDIHDRKVAEESLRDHAALTRSIIEASSDIVVLLDTEGKLVFMNGAGWRAAHMEVPDVIPPISWREFIPPTVHEQVEEALEQAMKGAPSRFSAHELVTYGRDAWWDVLVTPISDEKNACRQVMLVARDVTDTHRQTQFISWTATHDALTELPNRRSFNAALNEIVSTSGVHGPAALLMLDIDHFKSINDTLGHDAGDELLRVVAGRLRSAVRNEDFVARLGGDEFALILANVLSEQDALDAGEALLARLDHPFTFNGHTVDCRGSLGAALYPKHASSGEDLLKNADIALYNAKTSGRGRVVLFEPSMRSEIENRASMIALAQRILSEDNLLPYYQPKVSLGSGAVMGLEALLRWRSRDFSIKGPGRVAAALEDPHVACEIGVRMQEKVLQDIRRWRDRGVAFGHVSINVADAEFRNEDFSEMLLARLHRLKVPASDIRLEVTETVLLGRRAERVERAITLLDREGIQIVLDDFGTGYASLTHLKQFPVSEIKIDQSFVRDLHNPNAVAIIRALIHLGQNLGIEVVAEGIETAEQAQLLGQEGCTLGQGFLYSPAVPADQIPALLAARRGSSLAVAC